MLAASPYGYDPEGLVAAKDGTFWVSDEYGPFITHFDAKGRQIGRLSPFDESLPAELANRVPNKGMEGPDPHARRQDPGRHHAVRAAAAGPDQEAGQRHHPAHRHLRPEDPPDPRVPVPAGRSEDNSGAVSEITALSNTTFLVDERDGNVEPGAYKKLFRDRPHRRDRRRPDAAVAGATYEAAKGGLLLGTTSQTIEAFVGTDDTATATADLAAVGITPVTQDPGRRPRRPADHARPDRRLLRPRQDRGRRHDRRRPHPGDQQRQRLRHRRAGQQRAPFQLAAKILPNGQQDDGEYLAVDTTKLADPVDSATVTIYVVPKDVHVQR